MTLPLCDHRRILIVDDNPSIHHDFRKILLPPQKPGANLDQIEASLFGDAPSNRNLPVFDVDSAYQGQEGLELIGKSLREDRPYAMAFVDVRMPPGWDGIETTARIWEAYPDLQIVICTAYSDYSWEEMLQKLGYSDRLVILKKPFDNIEALQMAISLTEKWLLAQQAKCRLEDLERMVRERTRALEITNSDLASANRELKIATEKANEMAAKAQLASKTKAEFLANMSHEIRTPMNGVIGMTNLLLKTGLNEEQRDFAEAIRVSSHSLLTIINDILDFSKIEAGKLTLEIIDFDLRDVVEGALELLAERAHAKGIELASAIQLEVPTAVRGDPGRVRQILLNLIGNAIKFTARGEVIVRVSMPDDAGSDAVIRFDIRDTGIGIAPEAQSRLFEAFTQADGSTTRKFGGTGLGLAISRQLVSRMGGEIGLESAPGEGSNFWFTLRLEKQRESSAASAFQHAALVDRRVLVVDDNAAYRQILRHQIYAWRMRKSSAAGGAEALQMMRQAAADGRAYDLALLDLEMPEMDGLTLARAIKADPAISKTRLIVLSSMGRQLDVVDLQSAGIDACLIKPMRQSRLFDCLVGVMTKSSQASFLSVPAPQVAKAAPAAPRRPINSKVRILLAEDNPINRRVALGQLRALGYTADVAGNGLEAVQALETKTYDLIFMDCQMPELDGYEATRRIRQRFPTHPRIIAMTANVMQGDREKCLDAGMDDYVGKPVQENELVAVLKRWIPPDANRVESPASAAAAELAQNPSPHAQEASSSGRTQAPDPSLVDVERLRIVTFGEDTQLTELLPMFLGQADATMSELDIAIQNDSAVDVERLAHRLAGASSTCGMTGLLHPMRTLETQGREGRLDGARQLWRESAERLGKIKAFLTQYTRQMETNGHDSKTLSTIV